MWKEVFKSGKERKQSEGKKTPKQKHPNWRQQCDTNTRLPHMQPEILGSYTLLLHVLEEGFGKGLNVILTTLSYIIDDKHTVIRCPR